MTVKTTPYGCICLSKPIITIHINKTIKWIFRCGFVKTKLKLQKGKKHTHTQNQLYNNKIVHT